MSQVEEESTGMQLGLLPLAYISNLEDLTEIVTANSKTVFRNDCSTFMQICATKYQRMHMNMQQTTQGTT